MATVAVPTEICVVLIESNFLAGWKLEVPASSAFGQDSFASFVMRDQLSECGALGSRIFRMRMVVVVARTI